MTKKHTRKALVLSALSLLLCVAMLAGTTFAWFTDSVVNEQNIIASGTLDITMEWANGTEAPASANWQDASAGPIFEHDLWEPGYTEARHIKVANEGTLALKYDMVITPNGDISDLANVIDVYTTPFNATQVTDRDMVSRLEYVGTLNEMLHQGIVSGSLLAGEEFTKTIVLKMREEAGNAYQGLEIGSSLSIQLFANQFAYEEDSFGKDYDKNANTTSVTPETAQAAIWAAQEGEVIVLEHGVYDTLVIENKDGSSKKGITITSVDGKAGSNPTSDPFCVGHINLNASENITISNIYFDMTMAQPSYSKAGAAEYVASISGAKSGSNTGAKNIVIDNCKFNSFSPAADNYVAISFEEAGRSTSRATNITVSNCIMEKKAFNFVRMNYMSEGAIIISGNNLIGGTAHSTLNFTGNAADLMVRNNTFGLVSAFGGAVINPGWNAEKAALGTSRQGSSHITIEVTGNTFNNTLTGEGTVLDLKPSYTADNSSVNFSGNTFQGGLSGMTEADFNIFK